MTNVNSINNISHHHHNFLGTGCWKSFPYVQYDGLQSVNQYSVVSCQSYCQSLLACNIMNFDVRSSPPCQVQMYPGTYTFNPSPNVVAYLFDETCSNSTTTTTTSTATTSTTTISGEFGDDDDHHVDFLSGDWCLGWWKMF